MPRGKNTLAPNVLTLISNRIKNFHSEVRHSDFIGIRKAECIAQLHLCFILDNGIELTADITPRLLNKRQDFFNFFTNH